ITDYGESDGCAFFVMEYLAGEDLSFVVKREGRLHWSRIRPIAIQLLEALAAAHAVGIVHRDIKPHNCFLTPRPGNPDFVKMIDFGIAKLYNEGSEEQLTRTGAIMGTAEYMSPEQGLGEELDGRSDLYSVGIILYRMLTGHVPYKGNNPMAVLYQHIHADRVAPSVACPEAEIGPRVDALVLKSLAKDRDERFASAAEFIAELEAITQVGALRTGRSSSARHRPLMAAAAVVGVLGVGLAAWMWGGDSAAPTVDDPAPAIAAKLPSADPTPASPSANADAPGVAAPAAVGTPTPADPPPSEPDPVPAEPDPASPEPDGEGEAEGETDAPAPSEADAPPPRLPARRSQRVVRSRLGRIDSKVRACGKAAGLFPGESVRVVVTIAPSGRVQQAKVKGTFNRKGANCIVKVVRRTRFSQARLQQTIEHRFTL
nr:protein kinase [Deltaproteobacteria bacterium]